MSHPSWFCCHRLCPPKGASYPGPLAGTQCCISQCLHWGPQEAASEAWLHWWTGHLPEHSVGKKGLERDHTQFCLFNFISHYDTLMSLFLSTTPCLVSNIHVLFYSQSPTCAYLGTCKISVTLLIDVNMVWLWRGPVAAAVYQPDDRLVVLVVLQIVELDGEHIKQGGFLPQLLSMWSVELH